MSRVYLSRADIGALEESFVIDALRSGWIAPLGPHVDAFEAELADRVGVRAAVALSSGTAALHLALLGVGAEPGTVVLCPTATFAATVNAIVYTGARPVFVDSLDDGNVDPHLLLESADQLRRDGVVVSAAVAVDLYGRCADYTMLEDELSLRGIPLIEDAAESLGSMLAGRAAGSFGSAAALSFNGNKIMTTSGGGMLLTNDRALAQRARHLSTQARQPVAWYEHDEVGYNYRLSNILAALGRGQLVRLDEMVQRRRDIRRRYAAAIGALPGVRLLGATGRAADDLVDEPSERTDNCWLTCVEFDPDLVAVDAPDLIAKLNADDIEVRHLWKPMHRRPAFAADRAVVTGTSDRLFAHGLALPSGSALTGGDVGRVIEHLQRALCR